MHRREQLEVERRKREEWMRMRMPGREPAPVDRSFASHFLPGLCKSSQVALRPRLAGSGWCAWQGP